MCVFFVVIVVLSDAVTDATRRSVEHGTRALTALG